MIENVLSKLDHDFDKSVERLFELLRFPSISTDPAYHDSCIETADWLVKDLQSIGFEAKRRDTNGNPMVVAHHKGPKDDSPHILFYGHYDVQPVDPFHLWDSAPFEPEIVKRGGVEVIAARGASDDKGQLMTFVEALRALKAETGTLPVKVTILFEGEEESGSPSLQPFIEAHKQELKADFALVCDTSMWNATTPSISTGLRGLLGEEVIIHAANRDLHSGYYGGAALNPIHVLSQIIADLRDKDGKILIPHFYDGVEETPQDVLDSWNKLGMDAKRFLSPIGLSNPIGEKGRSLLEMVWARPTAEVNGISGGYEGDGFKTVIPAIASAKISFRLVHKQDPLKIREHFRAFVKDRLPENCTVEFKDHGASPAIQLPYDSPLLNMAKEALSDEWENSAVLTSMGGSIPIVGDFQTMLGMESLLIGFALDDDCIHSPNEKYNVSSFKKGQRSWARILLALANK